MPRLARLLGQGAAFAATAAALGALSALPNLTRGAPDAAYVTVSFVHSGGRGDCRRRSKEEFERLAPNMRRPVECDRRRAPVRIEVSLDGILVFQDRLSPVGLSGDGPSRLYQRFATRPGAHELSLRLGDTGADTYNHVGAFDLTLAPGQNVLVDFLPERGGFVLR